MIKIVYYVLGYLNIMFFICINEYHILYKNKERKIQP